MESDRKQTAWLILAVLVLGVLGIVGHLHDWVRLPAGASIVTDPIDAGAITQGLREAQTGRWLHGAWVGGNEFFRPVPSFLWLGCYHLWGEGGARGFLLFLYGWHLLFLLAAFFALRALFGRTVALPAVALFILQVMTWFGLASPKVALMAWKEAVEMEWGTFVLLALWLFLRFLRGGRRRDCAGALVLCLLGCLSKEAAYTLPVALILLLWRERRLTSWRLTSWRLTVPFWALVTGLAVYRTLLAVYRTLLFGGRGAHYWSNGSWPSRASLALMGGRPLETLIGRDWRSLVVFLLVGAVVTLLLGAGASLSWRRVRLPLAMAAGGVFALLALARGLGIDALTAGAMLTLPDGAGVQGQVWGTAAAMGGVVLLWASILSRAHRRDKAFAYGMLFLTYLPAMTAQVTPHVEYVPALWWGVLMAYAILDGAAWVREKAASRTGGSPTADRPPLTGRG